MRLVDSHCHLDDFARNGTLEAVIERARAAGVCRMVTVGTSPSDWSLYAKMAGEHPGVIYWTAGLHPTEVGEDWEDAVAGLASWWATEPRPVGLGEVGLDYFHLPKDPQKAAPLLARQKAAFTAQLEIAYQLGCPLVVHARRSFADVVAMIDKSGVDWKKVVFHCFSEGPDELRLLSGRGGRASFTGTVTYRNAANVLASALAQNPEKTMLETDSPWLSPEPLRGQENEPARVALTAEFLANALGLAPALFAEMTSRNAESFFDIT